LELLVLAATVFFVVNAYYDGKYLKQLQTWKKYYQMIFYGLLGLGIFWMLKKDPNKSKNMFSSANQFIRTMPINRGASQILMPFLDMTEPALGLAGNQFGLSGGVGGVGGLGGLGGTKTKRSVSETKKKYVASQQNWKCGECGSQLNHTYEVDHRVRLEYGGSNEVENLVALCRNCHGNKTAMEIMNKN
jgi:hypothetical protein